MKIFIFWMMLITSFSTFADAKGEIYDIKFGVVEKINGYNDIKDEVDTVQLIPKSEGYRFGFRIIPSNTTSYKYYTVSYLPDSPEHLTGALKNQSSEAFKSGFKSPEDTATGAVLIPCWFDEADPAGTYKIDLYINGVRQKSTTFNVIPRHSK